VNNELKMNIKEVKLYNDQRNAQAFHLFIYLVLLPLGGACGAYGGGEGSSQGVGG
jgi:hypothetical protein